MYQDDRERDAPTGGPESSDDRAREDASQSVDEFENAPPAMRSAEADAPDEAASTGDLSAADAEPISPADGETATRDADSASRAEEASAEAAGPPPQEAEAYPAAPAPPPVAASTAAHSVPATAVGESTQCPRCGTENRPGVAFCRNCGQRLVAAGVATTVERPGAPEGTQQCPRCGTANRAGVAFCQNCGANLRVIAHPAAGYVPPPATQPAPAVAAPREAAREASGGAVLGPLVLLVGAIGVATAWMLPFPYGGGSLWERSFGGVGGHGIAFWTGYSNVSGGILDKAYFGFAAAAPILAALLLLLAVGGFLRAAPGAVQVLGLVVSTLWAIGLIALFVVLEVAGNWNGDLVSVLRTISPAGIIFLLSGLIVLIGCATRFARS